MPGRGIKDFSLPERRFDIARKTWFETVAKAREEDALRAKLLDRRAGVLDSENSREARRLAKEHRKLARRLRATSKRPKQSIASARYMRRLRRRFTGALLKLAEDQRAAGHVVTRADVLRTTWNIKAADLWSHSAKQLKNEFRSALIRARAGEANGFIVAAFHTEFDPVAEVFQHHFHLLVSDEQIAVVDKLRKQRGFVSAHKKGRKRRKPARPGKVATPVRIRRGDITDWAYTLGYMLKSYALEYPREEGKAGTRKDRRLGRRIREPFHSQLLLWLDEQDPADFVLLMGVGVGKDGFKLK